MMTVAYKIVEKVLANRLSPATFFQLISMGLLKGGPSLTTSLLPL